MKAMVFAAGLGTRLRPLTDDRPKALVELNGRTLLEITLARLRTFGITEVVINAHHFSDKLVAYLNAHDSFGMKIDVSRENVLLDTGGGLQKAAHFFLSEPRNRDEPILIHNVDVVSTIDFARMEQAHRADDALATLAVQKRETSRYLVFDEERQLCGRLIGSDSTAEIVHPSRHAESLAFSGIHIVSPRLLTMLTEKGIFSIINSYLRLAGRGEKIRAFRADEYSWRDVGRREDLEQAAQDLQKDDSLKDNLQRDNRKKRV
ncbi:MAG: nucleotidyltransferase family protein [Terriglobales bacterium]|jgi:NDP-sugar pyrophosphorylase family protein